MTRLAVHSRSEGRGHADIRLAGQSVRLLPAGLAFLPAENMLVVADLHFGKGMAYAAQGQMLPPYDSLDTIRRLRTSIEELQPSRVVLLGDSFHRQSLVAASIAVIAGELESLAAESEFIWVTGNHDPEPGPLPGLVCPEILLQSGLCLRHEPVPDGRPEIIGHLHPAARLPTRAGSARRRCFVSGQHRLLLPAFGALTGTLPVSDPAIAALFPKDGARVFMMLGEALAEVPLRAVA